MSTSSSSSFKRVKKIYVSRPELRETAESRFWRSFRPPRDRAASARKRRFPNDQEDATTTDVSRRMFGPVTFLDFSPVPSTVTGAHDFAATASKRVTLYCGKTGRPKRTFRRFAGKSSGARFRKSDGKLIGCGDGPVVKVMQTDASASLLRALKGHTDVVGAVEFSAFDPLRIASVSDDKTVKLWDLTTGAEVATLGSHADYVRCVAESPSGQGNVWTTGSYDHTVKLWDAREKKCTMTLNHGDDPVQSVVHLSGSVVASAGGTTVKIWDLAMLREEKLAHRLENHQKAVTSIVLSESKKRLLTSSIDGHVKVFDTSSYNVLHALTFGLERRKASVAQQLLSLALSPDEQSIVVGSATGNVMLRTRFKTKRDDGDDEEARRRYTHGASQRNFNRGFSAPIDPEIDTVIVPTKEDGTAMRKKRKLRPHDRMLKSFQYRNALDAALDSLDPVQIVAVVDELVYRGGLSIALQRRNKPEDLIPLLKFLVRYISDPRYAKLLIKVCGDVLDLYAPILGQNVRVDELFFQLQHRIELELRMQSDLAPIKGSIDTLLSASSFASSLPSSSST